mmetsp:Transcript_140339/g.255185  ORF Transcript_140339/g.255185 Transcript_140339/m.255185 type:complete len:128 (-) Transcript_140339:40-423(-)
MGLGSADNTKSMTSIAVAIIAHKGLAAFALGSILAQSIDAATSKFAVLALMFSIATPIGGVLGVLLEKTFGGVGVGVCIAMTSGTFLQVGTMELIPAAMQPAAASRTGRCLTIGLSYAFFSALAIWV